MGTVRLGRHSGGVHTPSPARSSGSPPTVFARTRAAVLPVAETPTDADVEAGTARAFTSGPCDFCAAGGTPCVAAHSTARASYGFRGGPLHQVWRASDTRQSDGSYSFKNENSGLCLDVPGGSGDLGRQLDQWPCKNTSGSNQDFTPR
ncbi:arabinofuranosidase catalytic domain-containing protein [Streptomyces sp. NPDC007940]|jgi:hypothetical protein|uniref:RICIN domain-containing protein n=1 Tax=Streptomyces sp. NPDC007940 TaxID=3364796 RepID=UPI0036EACA09